MPSRRGLALILLFWLLTTGYVVYRDLWPRWFGDDPPPIRIDIADEATQSVPIRWTVYRKDNRIGSLQTRMKYRNEDDTFLFTSTYKDLAVVFGTIIVGCPQLETTIRVNREGDLREQTMTGKLEVRAAGTVLANASADVQASVVNGMLVGKCHIESPLMNIHRDLDPVPVPRGHALNPLMPVNKLEDIHPGRRWTIHENDPLGEAISIMADDLGRRSGFSFPKRKHVALIAEVQTRPQTIDRRDGPVECWIIEYRGEETRARTWVSTSDGRVMRQEAMGSGEILRLERDD